VLRRNLETETPAEVVLDRDIQICVRPGLFSQQSINAPAAIQIKIYLVLVEKLDYLNDVTGRHFGFGFLHCVL